MKKTELVKVLGPNRQVVEGELFKSHKDGMVTIKISEEEYITGIPVGDKK